MGDNTTNNIIIAGGGIFGLTSAIVLSDAGYDVTIIEKNNDILLGATKCNQNRIHYGFHYPRSIQTSEESLIGLSSFKEFYGDSINNSFEKFYAISKINSHVNSEQFYTFAQSIGLDLIEKWPDKKFLNKENIESCWLTKEPVFDYYKLREIILFKINSRKNIKILRNCTINNIKENVAILNNNFKIKFKYLINATYAGFSEFLQQIGCKPIRNKIQLCVMPILKTNYSLPQTGITIMDGPFCSLMPKGFNKEQYILYHVAHSVNQEYIGSKTIDWFPIKGIIENNIIEMSKQYYPILNDMTLIDSWITTRIVLPDHEIDDARPTLVLENKENIFSIFSGKITTCVDAANKLLSLIKNKELK